MKGAWKGAALQKGATHKGSNKDRGFDPTSCTVSCLGLPFRATPEQVVEFFSPLSLTDFGVNIINGADGRPSGQAIVTFDDCNDAQQALSYDRQIFPGASRYVEVKPISEEKALEKINSSTEPDFQAGILKLRGLPFS